MIRFVIVIYLRLRAALCCVSAVIHLIGEQGHEERKAAGVAGARLSTVESLRGITSTRFPLPINQRLSHFIVLLCTLDFSHKKKDKWTVTSQQQTLCGAYMEQALHQLVLFLPTFCTALCQLDNHSHVTCRQDGLHTLDQLVKQPRELTEEKERD